MVSITTPQSQVTPTCCYFSSLCYTHISSPDKELISSFRVLAARGYRWPQRTQRSQAGVLKMAETGAKVWLIFSCEAGEGWARMDGKRLLTEATTHPILEMGGSSSGVPWAKIEGIADRGVGNLKVALGLTCPALQKERDRKPQLLWRGQSPRRVQQ